MNTGVTITLIICVTLIILSAINGAKETKRRKAARTIFDNIFKSEGE